MVARYPLTAPETGEDIVEKHLNEREEQRIEELSSHGPPPPDDGDGTSAKNSKADSTLSKKSSIVLPLKSDVAQKLHRTALLAASIEMQHYAPTKWQIRNEIERGYDAFLPLAPSDDAAQKAPAEVTLSIIFSDGSGEETTVTSMYIFGKNAAKEFVDEVINKTQIVFETTLK